MAPAGIPEATFDPRPVVLEGRVARLEPLEQRHAAALLAAASHDVIWRYLPIPMPRVIETIEQLIAEALDEQAAGRQVPFAIVDAASGTVVGSTRYLDVQRPNRGLEVGWTWLTPAVQRSGINTECKWLLFAHAFETLGALRVQLKTDSRNVQSQRAIERVGAVKEGVLRSHMLVWGDVIRDSVMYSITRSEWPAVKERLTGLMARV